jgi:hypothetical protein
MFSSIVVVIVVKRSIQVCLKPNPTVLVTWHCFLLTINLMRELGKGQAATVALKGCNFAVQDKADSPVVYLAAEPPWVVSVFNRPHFTNSLV